MEIVYSVRVTWPEAVPYRFGPRDDFAAWLRPAMLRADATFTGAYLAFPPPYADVKLFHGERLEPAKARRVIKAGEYFARLR